MREKTRMKTTDDLRPSGAQNPKHERVRSASRERLKEREFVIAIINAVGDMISKTEAIDALNREFPL